MSFLWRRDCGRRFFLRTQRISFLIMEERERRETFESFAFTVLGLRNNYLSTGDSQRFVCTVKSDVDQVDYQRKVPGQVHSEIKEPVSRERNMNDNIHSSHVKQKKAFHTLPNPIGSPNKTISANSLRLGKTRQAKLYTWMYIQHNEQVDIDILSAVISASNKVVS